MSHSSFSLAARVWAASNATITSTGAWWSIPQCSGCLPILSISLAAAGHALSTAMMDSAGAWFSIPRCSGCFPFVSFSSAAAGCAVSRATMDSAGAWVVIPWRHACSVGCSQTTRFAHMIGLRLVALLQPTGHVVTPLFLSPVIAWGPLESSGPGNPHAGPA